MRQLLPTTLVFLSMVVTACASAAPLSDTSFCNQLSLWAKTVPTGHSSTVKLVRGGAWMVNHYKECEHSDTDKAGESFCRWLMSNTSTEFMEANINRAMSCLQGQRISGYLGNTGIESWSGKASFYNPHLQAENVRVTLEYAIDNSKRSREEFLQFTILAR